MVVFHLFLNIISAPYPLHPVFFSKVRWAFLSGPPPKLGQERRTTFSFFFHHEIAPIPSFPPVIVRALLPRPPSAHATTRNRQAASLAFRNVAGLHRAAFLRRDIPIAARMHIVTVSTPLRWSTTTAIALALQCNCSASKACIRRIMVQT